MKSMEVKMIVNAIILIIQLVLLTIAIMGLCGKLRKYNYETYLAVAVIMINIVLFAWLAIS
jgi:hypothetical protein